MVSNFSVASLFKVNLLPQGGDAQESVTKAEIEKVKKACQLEKVECEYDNIQHLIERENNYTESYLNEITPQRKERIAQHKERLERKANI